MRRTYKLSILFYAVVLAVVTIMAFNVKRSVNLFYLNVEALTDSEWEPPTVHCALAPKFVCPIIVRDMAGNEFSVEINNNIPTIIL